MNVFHAAAIAALLAGAGAVSSPQPVTLRIYAMDGFREHGTATLTPRGTDLIVTLNVSSRPPGTAAQFAHLHRGTCAHVASASIYELQPLRDGRSVTRLRDVNLELLIHGTYSILIHKSLSHESEHVACGTISGA